MFTGIIECIGSIKGILTKEENLVFTVASEFAEELKVDQSVSHNGVCLTVVSVDKLSQTYQVEAVRETLSRTNLGLWKVDSSINLERGMKLGERLDGHIVQGHVDQTGICASIEEKGGSWHFQFEYDSEHEHITIEKGSITVDGVSLTVVDSGYNFFSVAIIPYTYEHTLFNTYTTGSKVNLEFDVVGKYVARLFQLQNDKS